MAKKKSTKSVHWCCCGDSKIWGILLLIVGLWYLLVNLEIIQDNLPFWPIALILFGAWLLFRKERKVC